MGGDAVSPAPSGWSAAAEPSLDAPERVDPYHVWAHHSAWEGFGGGGLPEQLRVLFEVGGDKPPTERLIAVIASNPLNRGNTRFCTANIQGKDLALLVDLVREGILVRYQLGLARRPAPDVSGTEPLPKMLEPLEEFGVSGSSPKNLLRTLGVVDDGCCLAHAGLHTDWKSHFLCVWDQNQIATQCVRDPWQRYEGISYGEELTMGAINTWLAKHRPSGEIEELRFYNEALRRKSWGHAERSHGAGVLDVLAAMRKVEERRTLPLLFVQLPGDTVADTSGGSLGVYLLDGVRYIAQRTQYIADALRKVSSSHWDWHTSINVSLGSIAGPHDGSSITELALAELGRDPNVDIVLAAGNTAGRRIHGKRVVSRDRTGRFDVLVPPDNPRESYVEFWLPTDEHAITADDFEVTVTAPDDSRSPAVRVGQVALFGDGTSAHAAVVFARAVAQGLNGTMVLLAIRATRAPDTQPAGARPHGFWRIEVSTRLPQPLTVHAWVERNDIIVGGRRPQQSRFVDDDTGYLDDASTLSSVANGTDVTVVGAFRRQGARQARYSANGPALHGASRIGPDYLAPADESDALPGVQVGGFFSGTLRRMAGTSVAAPCVTRWMALESVPCRVIDVWTLDGQRVKGVDHEP
jgi:hypothetical protein